MKALTLWPEWAACIAHLDKRVENRGWRPPAGLVGERIAIHAGRHIGGRPGLQARIEADDSLPSGVCLVTQGNGWETGDLELGALRGPPLALDAVHPIVRSAIVCTAILGEPHRPAGRPWEQVDPNGWCWPQLDVRVLAAPVPCQGARGLWDVPDHLVELILGGER